jgi:hypothetical protein
VTESEQTTGNNAPAPEPIAAQPAEPAPAEASAAGLKAAPTDKAWLDAEHIRASQNQENVHRFTVPAEPAGER